MELSSRQVQQQGFSTSFRGYSPSEVRRFLDVVGRHISSLEEQLAIARTKASRAQDELDTLESQLDARILEAKQARDAIIAEARREAAIITQAGGSDDAGAVRTAAAIISEAETKADLRLAEVAGVTAEAHAEAERIISEAESAAELRMAEADRVLDNARREARDLHKESERKRTEFEARLMKLGDALAVAEAEGTAADAHVTVTKDGELHIDLTSTDVSQSL